MYCLLPAKAYRKHALDVLLVSLIAWTVMNTRGMILAVKLVQTLLSFRENGNDLSFGLHLSLLLSWIFLFYKFTIITRALVVVLQRLHAKNVRNLQLSDHFKVRMHQHLMFGLVVSLLKLLYESWLSKIDITDIDLHSKKTLRPLWFILFPNNNYLSYMLFPSAVHLVLPGHKQHALN